jgi:DNA-binding transcriptional ArsR family regulator
MDEADITEARMVTDLDTIRALMEPMRLAILRTLSVRGLRKLTAKEIAEELDEGQTKLYRHIKQLEELGLIHVAETRVVSGIIEKRYAASQKRLTIDGDLLGLARADPEDAGRHITATLDTARDYLLAELRAGRVTSEPPPDRSDNPDLRYYSSYSSVRLDPKDYAEMRSKVSDLVSDYAGRQKEGEGTVPVMFQALLFAVDESATAEPKSAQGAQ